MSALPDRPRRRMKREEVLATLRAHPELSNRAIAESCEVSHTYVGNLRRREGLQVAQRQGRDGRTYEIADLPVPPRTPPTRPQLEALLQERFQLDGQIETLRAALSELRLIEATPEDLAGGLRRMRAQDGAAVRGLPGRAREGPTEEGGPLEAHRAQEGPVIRRPSLVDLPEPARPRGEDGNPWGTFAAAVGRAGHMAVIGCSATKRAGDHPARELYQGGLFVAARQDVEARSLPWLVLSAEHGLVPPDKVLVSYETTMAQRKRAQLCECLRPRACARGWCSLRGFLSGVDVHLRAPFLGRTPPYEVEVHAGAAYVDVLEATLAVRDGHVRLVDPCRRMQIGQRLHWYALRRKVQPGQQIELFGRTA